MSSDKKSSSPWPASADQDVDEEDDYMTMALTDAATHPGGRAETSLQRRQRQRREGEERSRVKSKAQLAAEEAEKRERALSRSLLEGQDPVVLARRSKGFAMMAKMGFRVGSTLGKKEDGAVGGAATSGAGVVSGSASNRDADGDDDREKSAGADVQPLGQAEPIRVTMKEDRGGIGLESERKRKLNEAAEARGLDGGGAGAKKVKVVDEGEYRDRVRREREQARLEKQIYAAMKVAEKMDEDRQAEEAEESATAAAATGEEELDHDEGYRNGAAHKKKKKKKKKEKLRSMSLRPLKSINVLWRSLVRSREETERDRRMRRDLEQSLSRLPTYDDEQKDEQDKLALGRAGAGTGSSSYYAAVADDLDEEDPELEEFNALDASERLRRLVEFLRGEYNYCFWCKYTYPDDTMDGCPGVTEEDHD